MRSGLIVSIAIASLTTFATPSIASPVKETAHLIVTGGPNAGTWSASSDHGGCTVGLAGPGSWGNQLSNPKEKDPKKFNSLQLIVPNAKAAAAGAKEFYISFGFGPLMNRSAEYIIETRATEAKKKGSGVVTVEDKGATATVRFNVTSAEGYKFAGSIDCMGVLRAGN